MVNEVWRVVEGFLDYEVSVQGRVRRLTAGRGTKAGQVLRPTPNDNGYLRVFPRRAGKSHTRYVHRLVLEAFVGSEPPGHETNHIDGNKNNNALGNLEFKTASGNNQHAWDTGLMPRTRVKKAYCRNGHELTPENLVVKRQLNRQGVKVSSRRCRVCLNANQRNYVRRQTKEVLL